MNPDLRRLDSARVFQSVLPPAALSALHVPFDELTGSGRVEQRLELLGENPCPVLLVGAPGSGKSSSVAYTVAPENNMLGVLVPVPAYANDGFDVADCADQVIAALRRTVTDDGLDLGLDRPGQSRWRRSAKVDLGVLQVGVEEVLAAPQSGVRAQEDAIHQALSTVRTHGLEPVLILDDTDKWIGPRGHRHEAFESFFRGPARWLIELEAALVVHVNDQHLRHLAGSADWFTDRVTVPELNPEQAATVLLRRIERVVPASADLWDETALVVLTERAAEGRGVAREAIVLAGDALKEAVIADKDRVDLAAVEAAIASRSRN